MLFNSIDFAVFLPIVFLFYWLLVKKDVWFQNLLIVLASYVFYGWWDYRFLALILFSTVADYLVGRALNKTQNLSKRKILLWLSIFINIGFLGVFKYYNFFLENFISAFSFFGTEIKANSLRIILPVGISFYTFQTLSYSIDVYKRKLKPTNDFIAFAAFVSFFPQLVAGPIERAKNLLPQFFEKRKFDYSKSLDGLRQILWGLFKKVVIADNCAEYVNLIFNNYTEYNGSTLFLGALFFTFQIYGDFSGYSDIAIGTSRLFGFNLKQNFNFPYFSRDIAEFWRRWHISLSTWFRDYLYIPLGGSRGGTWSKIRNIFIIFSVSGFWHGANWTFVFWGLLNALYFLPIMLANSNRNYLDVVANNRYLPSFKEFLQMVFTFSLTVLAWVFFRAENISQAFSIIKEILSISFFNKLEILPHGLFILILVFLLIEWFNRGKQYGLERNKSINFKFKILDVALISFVFWAIIIWKADKEVEFIYFQF